MAMGSRFDDDRPPTPTPDGFQDADACSRPADQRQAPVPVAAATLPLAARATDRPAGEPSRAVAAVPTQRPPPPPNDRDDLFYLEGVGWVDDFGRTVDEFGASSGGSNAESKRHASTNASAKSNSRSTPGPGGTLAFGRGQTTSVGVKAPNDKKVSAQDQQTAWDAIPGI
ncbi:unnamed protein product [Polarella glacialis]|uniref:Uncharacterized protein n=1 Tax=Polarella glacialis TaxID=89957 RepID=A0A813GUA2_POLGL|nr:unnamed protein product [Polarella glacialis]